MSNDHPVTDSNVVSAPDSLLSLDLTGDAVKIDAKLYEVEDAGAHFDGVGSSGNLNHALLQQQLGTETAAIDGSITPDANQFGSGAGGETAPTFGAPAQLDLTLDESHGSAGANAATPGGSSPLPATDRGAAEISPAAHNGSFSDDSTPDHGGHDANAGGAATSAATSAHDTDPGDVPDVTGVTVVDVVDVVDVPTIDLPDIVGGVVDDVTDVIEDVVDDVIDVVDDLIGDVTDTVGDVVDDLTGIVGDVTDAVGGTVDDLTSVVGDVADTVGETVADLTSVVGDVTGTVGDTVGDLTGVVGDVADTVGETVADLTSVVGDVTGTVGDTVGDLTGVVGDVADTVGDTVGDLTGVVGDVADTVGETVADLTSVVGDVADTVGGTVADLTSVVGDVAETVGDTVGDLTGVVGDVAETVGDTIGDLTGVVGDVAETVGDTIGDLKGVVGDVAETVGDTIGDLTGVVGDVTGSVGDVASGLTDTVTAVAASVADITCPVSDLAGAIGNLTDQTANIGSETLGIVDGGLDAANCVAGVAEGAIAAVGDIASSLDQQCGVLNGAADGLAGVGDGVLGLLGAGDGAVPCGNDTDLTLDTGIVGGDAPIHALTTDVPLDPIEAIVGDIDIDVGANIDATGITHGLDLTGGLDSLLGAGDGAVPCGNDTDLTLDTGIVGGDAPIHALTADVPLDPVEAIVGDIDIDVGANIDAAELTTYEDPSFAIADGNLSPDLASQLLSNFNLEMSEAGGCLDEHNGGGQGVLDWGASTAPGSSGCDYDLLDMGGGALEEIGLVATDLPEPDGSISEGLGAVIDDSLFSHGPFHLVF